MSNKEMILNLNPWGMGFHLKAWTRPHIDPATWIEPDFWVDIARTAERGMFDAIFLADLMVQPVDVFAGPSQALEPTVLLPLLAGATEHIGLVATISSTYEHPFNLARRIATLDRLSNGRAGWNVVSTLNPAVASSYDLNAPHPGRQERYERMAEFIEITQALWDSWDPDALVADKEKSVLVDPERIHKVDYEGKYYRISAGPTTLPRSRQGRPVVFQSGGSPQGMDIAARYADAVYTTLGTLEQAKDFTTEIQRRTVAQGRPADAVRVLPGLMTIVGSTEAEAKAEFAALQEGMAPEVLLGTIAFQLGVDPDSLDWNSPLPDSIVSGDANAPASLGLRDVIAAVARDGNPTVKEIADRVVSTHRAIAGTPEQIADSLEGWFTAGAVAGFTILPATLPDGLETFVDEVIPLLQKRGLFRTEYSGTTLRDNFGLEFPEPQRA